MLTVKTCHYFFPKIDNPFARKNIKVSEQLLANDICDP